MIAHFAFKKWIAPRLSDEDRQAVLRNIASRGIFFLVLRYIYFPVPSVLASGITWRMVADYWYFFLGYFAAVVGGGICGTVGDEIGSKFMATLGAVFFAIGFIGCALFVASVLLVAVQCAWWLWRLKQNRGISA